MPTWPSYRTSPTKTCTEPTISHNQLAAGDPQRRGAEEAAAIIGRSDRTC